MVHENSPTSKEDLLTAIPEWWKNFDEEYCFKLMELMPERIQAVRKTQDGTSNN